MDLVKIINIGDEAPVVLTANGKVLHRLAPGDGKIVAWEQACSWFGDPTYDDQGEREHMYKLTQLFWKYQDGIDTPDSWAAKLPTVAVETLEGEPVWMLLFDPEREHPMPGFAQVDLTTDSSDVLILKQQNALLQQQMDNITRMLEGLTTTKQEELNPAELTALATVDATASQSDGSASELPKPVATAKNAADKPQTTKVR